LSVLLQSLAESRYLLCSRPVTTHEERNTEFCDEYKSDVFLNEDLNDIQCKQRVIKTEPIDKELNDVLGLTPDELSDYIAKEAKESRIDFLDELCEDLGVDPVRTNNFVSYWLRPISPSDYKGINKEIQSKKPHFYF